MNSGFYKKNVSLICGEGVVTERNPFLNPLASEQNTKKELT